MIIVVSSPVEPGIIAAIASRCHSQYLFGRLGGRGWATKKDGRLERELRVAANTGGGGGAETAGEHAMHGDTCSDNCCAPDGATTATVERTDKPRDCEEQPTQDT
ncbi:hypothetical protein NDU88_002349 [Pleurodeles waltl]|uniref:Uncharacterized protein n=1 Tax=Pleurodeles waltl TaxID=8319 RepID=A0AAV7VCZ5_PLEWA|nr:hypothetical protein NDU88_002349 [Pleurodeles waltl]